MKNIRNYRIGIVSDRHILCDKLGGNTRSYVYYIYVESGFIYFHITPDVLNLQKNDLVVCLLDEDIKYKIKTIIKIETNNIECYNENICLCYFNLESIDLIRENKIAIFSDMNSVRYFPEFHCELNDEYCLYFQCYDKKPQNNIIYLSNEESILVSLHFQILQLKRENELMKSQEAFVSSMFKHELDLKTIEIHNYVNSLNIENIANEYSIVLEYDYIKKIGGDDKLHVWLKSKEDNRRDIYLQKLLPNYLVKIYDDSGFCNLRSLVDSKDLENKRISIENKHKNNFNILYDVNHHISDLLYDFVRNKFLECQKNEIRKLENEIKIKEMEKWIIQNFSLKTFHAFYHLSSDEEFSNALKKYNHSNC
jgi:hypothetical protein